MTKKAKEPKEKKPKKIKPPTITEMSESPRNATGTYYKFTGHALPTGSLITVTARTPEQAAAKIGRAYFKDAPRKFTAEFNPSRDAYRLYSGTTSNRIALDLHVKVERGEFAYKLGDDEAELRQETRSTETMQHAHQ